MVLANSDLIDKLGVVCAVKGAGPEREGIPPGNWFASPGSNRSSSGGEEAAEASGVERRFRRLGEFAGRNERERCAGLEKVNAGAAPSQHQGKPKSNGCASLSTEGIIFVETAGRCCTPTSYATPCTTSRSAKGALDTAFNTLE